MKTAIVLGAFVCLALCVAAQSYRFDGKTLWRHVEILAGDDMEGRAPGSPGLERAEAYLVDQLKKIGLTPAGVSGYFQPVKLVTRKIVEKDSTAALVRKSTVEPLVLGEDAFFPNDIDVATKVEAPLVFLGYGLQISERNYDDFAGLDLKGKIAVTVPGRSAEIEQGLYLQYSATPLRWKQFRDAGLVGWIEIAAPEASWPFLRTAVTTTTMYLAADEFNDAKGQQIHMLFNPAHADKLFAGSGHTAEELFALGRAYERLPRFALQVGLRASTRVLKERVDSANVVAKLEGSDPRLRNEYVVLSAHIDHLGVREPVNGDRIYNGAFDNASGVAALLDIAAALKREGTPPRRSVLFTFFTGEEPGKRGSRYFVAHPTVNLKSMVADLNIDVVLALAPLKAIWVLGAEDSDLGDAARRAAESYNVADMAPDPETDPIRFANNDQASFAFAGIPAVNLRVGLPGEQNSLQQKWLRERYHTPFDDPQQPISFEGLATYEEIARALLLDVANSPRRPNWKSSSFYTRYARQP